MFLNTLSLRTPCLAWGEEDIGRLEEHRGAEHGLVQILSLIPSLACSASHFPQTALS